jgi:hypothetical protein
MDRSLALLITTWLLSVQTAMPPAAGTPSSAVGSIHGAVKDETTGASLPNCSIQVSGADFKLFLAYARDSESRYRAADIPPGPLLITASCVGHQMVLRSVRLGAGEDLAVDFLIPSTPTISGRVLDQNKKPMANMSVWIIQSEYRHGSLHYSSIGPRTTGKDGGFTFESGLEAGRGYYLLADRLRPDSAAQRDPLPLGEREPIDAPTYYGDAISLADALPLVLLPGEHREQVDIKIRRSTWYCVDGNLEVSRKPAFLGYSIFELPLAGTEVVRFRAYPADDGSFRVCNLTSGQYRLSPTSSQTGGGQEFAITDSDVHRLRVALDTVPVQLELAWDGTPPPEPPASPDSETTVKAAFSIVLQIPSGGEWMSPEALPLAPRTLDNRISVNLFGVPDGATRLKSELAPYDGPFGSEVPTGDYAVQVGVPPGTYLKEITYGGVSIAGRLLQLVPGTRDTLRILVSQDAARLTYRVSDASGGSVPYATVLLSPDSATTEPLLSAMLQQARTDQSGTCMSGALAPGKYRVLALTRPVRLIPEDMHRLMVALAKATHVELSPKASLQVNLQPVPID